MDRRNFLKTGGIALLGSLATGSAMALTTPGALGGEGADKKAAVALAMNHFGVSEADLKKVLAAALEKGGDYADLFFEHTISNSIRLMDGAVNNSYSNIDYGVGVRVLTGDQSGYAYVENITVEDMLKAYCRPHRFRQQRQQTAESHRKGTEEELLYRCFPVGGSQFER